MIDAGTAKGNFGSTGYSIRRASDEHPLTKSVRAASILGEDHVEGFGPRFPPRPDAYRGGVIVGTQPKTILTLPAGSAETVSHVPGQSWIELGFCGLS